MAHKNASLEHLQKVSLFSSFTTKELEKVAKAGDEVTIAAGTMIVDQGQTGTEAFIILSGSVSVKRNGRKIAQLGPGAIVGELSLLDHGPRTATVTCDTECEFLVIAQRRFLGVIDEVPTLSHRIMGALASRIRDLDRQSFG